MAKYLTRRSICSKNKIYWMLSIYLWKFLKNSIDQTRVIDLSILISYCTGCCRSDIISILLCASELLFPACSSVSMYLDPGSSQLPHYSIHNFCSVLLADMAIVASPLEMLYKYLLLLQWNNFEIKYKFIYNLH